MNQSLRCSLFVIWSLVVPLFRGDRNDYSCRPGSRAGRNPLPSWNDGAARK